MRLAVLDIPDDDAQLAAWLERELKGLQLRELILELEAFLQNEPSRDPRTLLGGRIDEVLQRGLSVLPATEVRQLLRTPQSLLELQERVLIDGGDYWQSVPLTAEHQQLVNDGLQRIQASTDNLANNSAVPSPNRRWLVVVLLAASILIGLGVWQWRVQAPVGWGWDEPGALAVDLPPAEYLNHLATATDAWFNKRPDTTADIELRLMQFSRGCQTLIDAPHTQLGAADREWLRDKCRAWQKKLNSHRADLKAGRDPLSIRSAADETVRKLQAALRKRAHSLT